MIVRDDIYNNYILSLKRFNFIEGIIFSDGSFFRRSVNFGGEKNQSTWYSKSVCYVWRWRSSRGRHQFTGNSCSAVGYYSVDVRTPQSP